MWSGIITAVMLLLFIGICIWAFSPSRKRDFDAAARLPLSDDPPATDEEQKRTQQENDR
jgi:cytochrome c oxidase cbb3-type subunit 4